MKRYIRLFAMIVVTMISLSNVAQAQTREYIVPISQDSYSVIENYPDPYQADIGNSPCNGETYDYYGGHEGSDYSMDAGKPVYAAAAGIVHYYSQLCATVSQNCYGYYLGIDHGNDEWTLYAHLHSYVAAEGRHVEQGDIIALSGSSGPTYPHLHFEVLTDVVGSPVNGDPHNPYYCDDEWFTTSPPIYADTVTDLLTLAESVIADAGYDMGSANGKIHFYDAGVDEDGNPLLPDSDHDVYIQDHHVGGSGTQSAVLYDAYGGARKAYVVHSGFWDRYSGACGGPNGECNENGVVDCGPPINNEYSQGGNTARQDFRSCYLYWDGSQAEAHPYAYAAPGWFQSGYWNSTQSYAFAEAYERNGSRNDVGYAFDKVDGAGVHHWGNNTSLPLMQDFMDGNHGECVIMHNDEDNQAYVIRSGMWEEYMDLGPEAVGHPCEDEHATNFGAEQEFEFGVMEWYGGANVDFEDKGCDGCDCTPPGGEGGDPEPLPQDRTLISANNSDAIYMYIDGYKRWISETVWNYCGYAEIGYSEFSQSVMESIDEGEYWGEVNCLPQEGELIRGYDSDAVYMYTNNQKRWISLDIWNYCSYNGNNVVEYPETLINNITQGDHWTETDCLASNRTLIRGDQSDAIYMYIDGYKRWISLDTWNYCGYAEIGYSTYSQSMVNDIPEGPYWIWTNCIPQEGELIQGYNDNGIYVYTNSVKRWVSLDVWYYFGFQESDVHHYPQTLVLNGIPDGANWTEADMPVNGQLIKSSDPNDNAIYMYENGVKRWIAEDVWIGCGYVSYDEYPQVVMDNITTGSNWQLEDCGEEVINYYGGGVRSYYDAPPGYYTPFGYYTEADNAQHVVYIDQNHDIIELWHHFDQGQWNARNLTDEMNVVGAKGYVYGYYTEVDDCQHVVYWGDDYHVHELWYCFDEQVWYHANLTSDLGAVTSDSVPSVHVTPDAQHVIYNYSGHVYELYYDFSLGYWQHANISSQAGGWISNSAAYGYYTAADDAQHVLHRDGDRKIVELWYDFQEGVWHAVNLSNQTAAPQATGAPRGYYTSGNQTQHVVYRDTSGNVIELWYDLQEGVWHMDNISYQANAPAAYVSPMGYYTPYDDCQHVVYWGNDYNVHELWYCFDEQVWHHSNLTDLTGAPQPNDAPMGYYTEANNTQHVVYNATNGDVIELWYDSQEGQWHYSNLTQEVAP